jgi:Flp pilus assembly pilin Flp
MATPLKQLHRDMHSGAMVEYGVVSTLVSVASEADFLMLVKC